MLQDLIESLPPTDPEDFLVWRQQQLEEISSLKEEVETTKRLMSRAQEELDRQRDSFERDTRAAKERLDREKQLFDMKWKLMQDEIASLADERQKFDREKAFYTRVKEHEDASVAISNAEIFFIGVGSEKVLKKRYKDLLKIYHPDNIGGDTAMIQEINKEYDSLSRKLKRVTA